MKTIKKIMAVVFAMAIMITAFPMQADAAVKLNATKKTMYVGEKTALKVTGTKSKVKWSTSNKKVATVTQKGKVTAKAEGSTTVKAKVGKKNLSCKITVKSKFSASEATKNISCTLQDTGRGVVAILKNNNKIAVSVSAKMAYYSGGKMLDTASDENYAFESGAECALFFHAPYDSSYNRVSYDDYKITMSVEKMSSSIVCDAKKIGVSSNVGAENISAEVKNNSGKEFEFVEVAVVYYNAKGEAIGYEDTYANCKTSGSIDYISLNFPHDDNYDTITPDTYKTYVNYAYAYNW